MSSVTLSAMRDCVLSSYQAAKAANWLAYCEGDVKATAEYIFVNQVIDAGNIVNHFYTDNCRVVSIQKKTKVGADGLMIEIAKQLTTHSDDDFMVNPANVRIITGMSNASWEKDIKERAPACFKNKIFHHGKLSKSDLLNINNALIIIDEIDSGDKPAQILHRTLKDAGILDINHMNRNNNRFVFISATMVRELYDLYQWGDFHKLYKMTIPDSYVGHKDFLEMGIIDEFYSLTGENADRWVREDILDRYGDDYRVHIVRLDTKTINPVHDACIRNGICFKYHTSADRLSVEDEKLLFQDEIKTHYVLGVKGFFRRANLIPNAWKLRIGATHERATNIVDFNVQIQGLPGRMTGYWRNDIESGHLTGPHRTSLQAIESYEAVYNDPFGVNDYQTNGFKKCNGKVTARSTMLTPSNVANLVACPLPDAAVQHKPVDINSYRIYEDELVVKDVCKILGYSYSKTKDNANGFKETSLNRASKVVSLTEAVNKVPTAYGTNNGSRTYRTYYPCYTDINDKTTLRFVVIIRPGTKITNITQCDSKHSSIPL